MLVIGAGPAGLGAARQLKFFGFDVKILEARVIFKFLCFLSYFFISSLE